MEKDFYLERRGLASYFEKEWSDLLFKNSLSPLEFVFSRFDPSILYCDFNQKVSSIVCNGLNKVKIKPKCLLEVGPALGRTFYEVVSATPTIKKAFLIEPSQNLFSALNQLFNLGGTHSYPVLKGNEELAELNFNSDELKARCSHVKTSFLNLPFDQAGNEVEKSELVICLNVIDQCHSPLALIEFLKEKTSPGGILVLGCTYQWQKKYLGSDMVPFTDIKECFNDHWKLLEETNLPFSCRGNERFWQTFLSHVVILQNSEDI